MSDTTDRLTRLIELATTNAPENRRTLAIELCDLLLDWPAHHPVNMREPFEALLEKTVRGIDDETRRMLAEKFGRNEETPVYLLNEFYFDSPADARDTIVLRNALMDASSCQPFDECATDEAALLAAARGQRQDELLSALARTFGIDLTTAYSIIEDRSGRSLAIACKGAHISRATFSAVALLSETGSGLDEIRERLSVFDGVPMVGAERLLDYWRTRQAA
jgi:hypothetical protein